MKGILPALTLCCTALHLAAQGLPPEEIVQRFAARETEFGQVWQSYTYRQQITVQVLNARDQVAEQKDIWVEVFFTADGRRQTRVVREKGSLRSIGISQEDIDDAVHRQPFVLTTEQLPRYKIEYKGRERVDELDTYVFEVKPRDVEKGERYFKGRIWVDDLDFQIVMSRGRIVPDYANNKFPEFETVRQQVDGQFWFPVWTKAEDVLQFGNFLSGSRRVHVREFITYEDFQKFEVKTSIRYQSPEEPPQE